MDRDEILTRLRERIVRYAASQLQGSSTGDQAQDLAQEVLIVLHEKYPELDRIEDLLPLSLEIARLKIWAARRKSGRRGEDRQIPVDDLPLAASRSRSLRAGLAQRTCGSAGSGAGCNWASGAANCFA